ncbi:MAG: hypothetical protein ACREV7_03370 [Steroidobacteraceae bacterium]
MKGKPKTLRLEIRGMPADARVAIERVDDQHGNVLNGGSALPPPQIVHLRAGDLSLALEPDALVLRRIGLTASRISSGLRQG